MPNISLVLIFARWWGSSRAVQSQTLLVLLVIVDTDKGEQGASPCSCHCERNQRVSEIKYSDKKTQVSIYLYELVYQSGVQLEMHQRVL